jgi:hypothetical protein
MGHASYISGAPARTIFATGNREDVTAAAINAVSRPNLPTK